MIIPHNDLPFSTFYLYLYTCFAKNLPLQCNLPVTTPWPISCILVYLFFHPCAELFMHLIRLFLNIFQHRYIYCNCCAFVWRCKVVTRPVTAGWIFKSVIRPLRSTLATASTTFIRPLHSPFIETQINPVSLYKDEDRKLYSWGNNLHSTVPFNK